VLQTLVNLIRNAKHACDESLFPISRSSFASAARKRSGPDPGRGQWCRHFAREFGRIFTRGFTTRPDGHGFGLHSCLMATQEMGGALTGHSDGPGLGAVSHSICHFNPKERQHEFTEHSIRPPDPGDRRQPRHPRGLPQDTRRRPADGDALDEREALLFQNAAPASRRQVFRIDSAFQGQEGCVYSRRRWNRAIPTPWLLWTCAWPRLDGVETTVKLWRPIPICKLSSARLIRTIPGTT